MQLRNRSQYNSYILLNYREIYFLLTNVKNYLFIIRSWLSYKVTSKEIAVYEAIQFLYFKKIILNIIILVFQEFHPRKNYLWKFLFCVAVFSFQDIITFVLTLILTFVLDLILILNVMFYFYSYFCIEFNLILTLIVTFTYNFLNSYYLFFMQFLLLFLL